MPTGTMSSSRSSVRPWVLMLLENNAFPQDVRVRQEARSLARAGYRVTVIAPRSAGQPRRQSIEEVEVRRFRLRSGADRTTGFLWEFAVATGALHWHAIQLLARGADVLHLHNPPDTLFPAGLVARLLRRSVVFDHHDLTPELVESRTDSRWMKLISLWLERQTFRISSLVLSSNESYAQVARTRGRKAPESVVVVRNGPMESTLSVGAEVRSGVLSDPRLVYVGALAPQDNVGDLPAMLAFLRDAHGISDCTLTIVGDGPSRETVMVEADRLGVADQVRVTGWIDSDQVPPIIRGADICVDPAHPTSLNDRSTMIKIAEYIAGGRPVVAYDLTETRRTAADAACLVAHTNPRSFADRVASLARSESSRREAAEAARRRGPAITWEHSESALLGAYASLLSAAGRPAPSPST